MLRAGTRPTGCGLLSSCLCLALLALTGCGSTETPNETPLADQGEKPQSYGPQLAESWEFSDDGLTLTFQLRDASWSDGRPIGAADVRYTWLAQTSPDVPWSNATSKQHIIDVEVLELRRVAFHFDDVYPYQFADAVEGGIPPEHVFSKVPFENWTTHDWSSVNVRSGPFLLERHEPGHEIVLSRNTRYFKPRFPRLDRVVVRVVPDVGNLLTQLAGLGLMAVLALSYFVPLFPASSMQSVGAEDWSIARRLTDRAWHLVLPACVLGIGSAAAMMGFVRAGLLETLSKGFVKAAHAKGLTGRRVVLGSLAADLAMAAADPRVKLAHGGGARCGDSSSPRGGGSWVPAPGRLVLLAVALLLVGDAVMAESPVQLISKREARSAWIIARNSASYPVTVSLELTERRNLIADRELPLAATVPAGGEQTLLSLDQDDPGAPWNYRYRWSWAEGSHEARHDETRGYTLPYPPGFAFMVAENQDEDPSHGSPHAVDWLTPAGTPVSAARGGTVARVDPGADGLLHVLHPDGTIGCYLGLGQVDVRLGDPVETGDELGVVAATRGFAKPHLHFHVLRATDESVSLTVPVTFVTSEGDATTLDAQQVYMRPHEGSNAETRDALPVNAVRSLTTCRKVDRSGHPLDATNLFGPDEVVHVHVSLGARDIYTIQVEFLRVGETKPASIRRFPTEPHWDGVDLTLDLSGVPEPEGDWVVRALIAEEVQALTEFRVAD